MAPTRFATAATCVAALLGAALLPGTAGAAPRPATPVLEWEACDGGFDCATVEVPMDHGRPHGRTIELALIRARAADPDRRIGSLFLHPGGPGGSGVDFVRAAPPPALAAITRRFDLIGFDARGAGHSRPRLDCGVDQEQEGIYAHPFTRPETLDTAALAGRARRYVRRCLERAGALMPHMSTADVARDLDLLRAAVGDEQLTYIGNSYGSLVGATYASLFPGRARALALTAAVDADTWTNRPLEALREQTASFEDVLDRFFAACAAHPVQCGFGGADPEDAFETLLERLDARPIPAPASTSGRPLDGDDLRVAATDAMGSPRQWPPFAAGLAAAEAGDGSLLRQTVDDVYAGASQDFDVSLATLALDQRYPRRVGPFLAAGRHAASLSPTFAFNSGYSELPFGLVPFGRRDAFAGPFRNAPRSAPALIVGTTHDPNTPYAWSKRLTADLGNARLLTVRGDGHDVLTSLNPCVVGTLLAYLEEGVLPPAGASCRREPPFGAA